MKPGIQYRHPWIYNLFIKLIHRRSVLEIFRKKVGSQVSVFDVAAGFGRMSGHIDPSNTYRGIDLNETYIQHARSQGLHIDKGNIFDAKEYVPSDVLILVDVVHHIPPDKQTQLFDLVFAHAKKRVVIMEPAFVNLEKRYGLLGKPVDWIFKKFDSDGVNIIENWLTEEEYMRCFSERFGSASGRPFAIEISKVFPYHIVTYTRER